MPHPYAFNLFSHDTPIDPETGYNDEETKVIAETRKIFADPDIQIGVTFTYAPLFPGVTVMSVWGITSISQTSWMRLG